MRKISELFRRGSLEIERQYLSLSPAERTEKGVPAGARDNNK